MNLLLTLPVQLPAGWAALRRFHNDDKVIVIHAPGAAVTVDLRRRNFMLGVHALVHKFAISKYRGHPTWMARLFNDAVHALRQHLQGAP